MIDKKMFGLMVKEFHKLDEAREKLIKKSRDILKLSKQIIYALHRDDLDQAKSFVKDISVNKKEALKIISSNSNLKSVGAYKIAISEYVEAMIYYHYLKDKMIVKRDELEVDVDHYIMGLIDFTGELGRKAVQYAGKKRFSEVIVIKDVVDEIFGALLNFEFRESDIRRKFDSVKYNLKKLEDLVLDLELKDKI